MLTSSYVENEEPLQVQPLVGSWTKVALSTSTSIPSLTSTSWPARCGESVLGHDCRRPATCFSLRLLWSQAMRRNGSCWCTARKRVADSPLVSRGVGAGIARTPRQCPRKAPRASVWHTSTPESASKLSGRQADQLRLVRDRFAAAQGCPQKLPPARRKATPPRRSYGPAWVAARCHVRRASALVPGVRARKP